MARARPRDRAKSSQLRRPCVLGRSIVKIESMPSPTAATAQSLDHLHLRPHSSVPVFIGCYRDIARKNAKSSAIPRYGMSSNTRPPPEPLPRPRRPIQARSQGKARPPGVRRKRRAEPLLSQHAHGPDPLARPTQLPSAVFSSLLKLSLLTRTSSFLRLFSH